MIADEFIPNTFDLRQIGRRHVQAANGMAIFQDKAALSAALRSLADKVDQGLVLIQNIKTVTTMSPDDFLMDEVRIVYAALETPKP